MLVRGVTRGLGSRLGVFDVITPASCPPGMASNDWLSCGPANRCAFGKRTGRGLLVYFLRRLRTSVQRHLKMPITTTPSWRIRLKARVDLGDQTAEFIPFGVISTTILTYFYLVLGTNLRILISVINTRFQLDALEWCCCQSLCPFAISSLSQHRELSQNCRWLPILTVQGTGGLQPKQPCSSEP